MALSDSARPGAVSRLEDSEFQLADARLPFGSAGSTSGRPASSPLEVPIKEAVRTRKSERLLSESRETMRRVRRLISSGYRLAETGESVNLRFSLRSQIPTADAPALPAEGAR